MQVRGAVQAALWGIESATSRMNAAAERIATPGAESTDLVRALVDTTVATRSVEVNTSVRRVADEMIGDLIDLVA